jgi:type II secretory pathway component GspD/PulD (secretin)
MANGDIVLLGGLAENKTSDASTGLSFLPSFFKANSDETTKTEILLVLELQKV